MVPPRTGEEPPCDGAVRALDGQGHQWGAAHGVVFERGQRLLQVEAERRGNARGVVGVGGVAAAGVAELDEERGATHGPRRVAEHGSPAARGS